MSKLLANIEKVSAGYNGETVLRDISLKIHDHDFIGVIGPNGGGKTTMVKVLLGLLAPYKGKVSQPNGPIRIGYLPQAAHIDRSFPITVQEVVESGLQGRPFWRPGPTKAQKQQIAQILDETGLSSYAQRPIGELSGGQLQRTLLGRALIKEPDLLVLDEPNTYVDKTFEGELYKWLQELNKKMAILLVSHDVGTISSMVKTIACVNQELHYHPSNVLSAELLKVYNCPIDVIAHGPVPHRVLGEHRH